MNTELVSTPAAVSNTVRGTSSCTSSEASSAAREDDLKVDWMAEVACWPYTMEADCSLLMESMAYSSCATTSGDDTVDVVSVASGASTGVGAGVAAVEEVSMAVAV
jgi:hypothetical protein